MAPQQPTQNKASSIASPVMDIEAEWNRKKSRFFTLWRSCLSSGKYFSNTSLDKIWNTLTQKYTEPGRYYHCRRHILECIDQFDLISTKLDNPNEVELSIWFHDIVYDPTSNDKDEVESANLFKQLATNNFPEEKINLVCDLIVATMHTDDPQTPDEAYLVDIDLSAFGFAWERFKEDVKHLHMESPHLSKKERNEGTFKFYTHLLQKPRIFFTDTFYFMFENIARTNIHRFINEFLKPE